jgi:hypothetical protein
LSEFCGLFRPIGATHTKSFGHFFGVALLTRILNALFPVRIQIGAVRNHNKSPRGINLAQVAKITRPGTTHGRRRAHFFSIDKDKNERKYLLISNAKFKRTKYILKLK